MILELTPTSLIAEGTRVVGNVSVASACQLLGVVEGTIVQAAREPLHVVRSGWVHGDIESAGPVCVHGRVEGNIRSQDVVEVFETAQIRGQICAPRLIVHPGARVDGHLTVDGVPTLEREKSDSAGPLLQLAMAAG